MQDLRQTRQYIKYMNTLGWATETVNHNFVFLKKVPIIGTIAKLQRPPQAVSDSQLSVFNKKHKISIFYLELPLDTSHKAPNNFKAARYPFLPPKTIQIDLTKSRDQLLKAMKPKTRYNIKIAQKRGVQVLESTKIDDFISLWASSARSRFALPQAKEIKALWEAFGKRAHLLLAHHNKQLLAGLLIAHSRDTAFYMYAASNKEGRKLFAPTLVTWEAIKLAKSLKLTAFDFEGIYDERYKSTKSWRGFTKFKKGFGGKVIEYPKTIVYFKNPLAKVFL